MQSYQPIYYHAHSASCRNGSIFNIDSRQQNQNYAQGTNKEIFSWTINQGILKNCAALRIIVFSNLKFMKYLMEAYLNQTTLRPHN